MNEAVKLMLASLRAPFPPDKISWRVGPTSKDKARGMALCYIDARDVQDRLDEACGVGNWQCRYPHTGDKTVCEIGIRFDNEWVWKADGAGDTDMEASKGALSDAFKRAAVRWGIGRYLYDVDSPWVEIEEHGKSYSIKQAEFTRLRAMLGGKSGPAPKPPASDDKAAKAEAWATNAIAEVTACNRQDDLAEWEARNEKAVVALAKAAPHSHRKLVAAIQEQGARIG
jgi:hypothetical protein